MIKRVLSFLSAVAVLCSCMTVTVRAAESNASGWIELLEVVSIQDNGENIFRMVSSYTLQIPTPREMRLRRIDMLIRIPTPHPITGASCTVNTTTTTLEVYRIGDNLVRIIGELPDATYETINIKLTRSGTTSQPYEVLSCKVTPLLQQEFVADAEVYLESYGDSGYYGVPEIINFWRDNSVYYSDSSPWMARVHVYDWQKYDSLSVWGSSTGASIESIRASVGTTALDYTCNYIDVESGESFIDGDPASTVTHDYGKYMFSITIDLSGVDRTLADPLYIYFSGSYDITVLTTFNCQYVNGQIVTADTSNVTWWQKFTSFMSGLFGGESSDAEDFRDDAAQKGEEMDDLNNQLQEVTKPPVDEVQTDLDGYISPDDAGVVTDTMLALTGDSLITSMLMITLTIALVAYILFGKR